MYRFQICFPPAGEGRREGRQEGRREKQDAMKHNGRRQMVGLPRVMPGSPAESNGHNEGGMSRQQSEGSHEVPDVLRGVRVCPSLTLDGRHGTATARAKQKRR